MGNEDIIAISKQEKIDMIVENLLEYYNIQGKNGSFALIISKSEIKLDEYCKLEAQKDRLRW